MFSYLSPGERVPAKHPSRPIRSMVDDALKALSPAFQPTLLGLRPAIDSSGEVVASVAFAGALCLNSRSNRIAVVTSARPGRPRRRGLGGSGAVRNSVSAPNHPLQTLNFPFPFPMFRNIHILRWKLRLDIGSSHGV